MAWKKICHARWSLERAAQLHDLKAKDQLAKLLKNDIDNKSTEVVDCYQTAAKNQEPWALLGLGKLYALGVGVPKNYAQAIALFKAAVVHSPQALCELGKLYVLGYGKEADYEGLTHYEAAFACFTKVKEQVPEAGCELGKMYITGCGVKQDHDMAFMYIQAAALQDVPEALYLLGLMYQVGCVVKQDRASAIQKCQAAAALGSADAMCFFGRMYLHGEGVTPDYVEALRYYSQAEALGSLDAINGLGWMYARGLGVEKNPETAVEKYQAAAALGNHIALYNLGGMYRAGLGVAQDYSAAIDCFRRAAELGDQDAWKELEAMQIKKQGDVRDYQAACAYYDKAHEQGLPRVGAVYHNEYGYDDSQILSYYQQAAKQNDPRALYNLGMLHLEGRGVQKNLPRALEYLEQAAQLGDMEAEYKLRTLPERCFNYTQSQILIVYTEAAKQNKTWALFSLGKLYVDGTAVERDRLKGWGYLEELVSLAGNNNLSAVDKLRISEANELLSKVKSRGKTESSLTSSSTRTGKRFYLSDVELNERL